MRRDAKRVLPRPNSEQRKLLNQPASQPALIHPASALLSPPPLLYSSAVHVVRRRLRSLYFAIHLEEAKVKDLSSPQGSRLLSAPMMSGRERKEDSIYDVQTLLGYSDPPFASKTYS